MFREHCDFLARQRYRTIGLTEAVRKLNEDNRPPEKLVVITFDDGFEDFYTEAFPILSTHGFTATVFLPTCVYRRYAPRVQRNNVPHLEPIRELRNSASISDPTR